MNFRQKKSSICERKFLKLTLKMSKKVFVVFDAISIQFSKDFVIISNKINNKKKRDMHLGLLKRKLQRFAAKTLQNDSK